MKISLCTFLAGLASLGIAGAQPAHMVADLTTGVTRAVSVDESLLAGDGRLYFSGTDASRVSSLWVADSAPGSARLVKIVTPGPGNPPHDFVELHGIVYFVAGDPSGIALWRSDGTTSGTELVSQVRGLEAPFASEPDLRVIGDRLAVKTDGGIWFSDGSTEGTIRGTGPPDGAAPLDFVGVGSQCYSLWSLGGMVTIWKGDPSTGAFLPVFELPGARFCHIGYGLTGLVGKALFFSENADQLVELWVTDGTGFGTHSLAAFVLDSTDMFGIPCNSWGPTPIASLERGLLFGANDGIHARMPWISDGTAAGTHLVADLCPDECPSDFSPDVPTSAIDGFAYFSAFHNDASVLWRSNGTAEGTAIVLDPGTGLEFENALVEAVSPPYLYFSTGSELWRLDAGNGSTTALPFGLRVLAAAGSVAFLDGAAGLAESNASSGFTVVVESFQRGTGSDLSLSAAIGGRLLFVQRDSSGGGETLWSTGGGAGTAQLGEFLGASGDSFGQQVGWTTVGSRAFFVGATSSDDGALWVTDGTEAGTREVTPLPYVLGPASFRDQLYFASLGELWRSDGTAAGTVQITHIKPNGQAIFCDCGDMPILFPFRGSLYFSADDGIHGSELWRSDGTATGTALIKDTIPGPQGNGPFVFAGLDDRHFLFDALGAQPIRVWESDGTEIGTFATQLPNLRSLVRSGSLFYYIDFNGTNTRLWRTDGTDAGTFLLVDGAAEALTDVLGTLFFVRTDAQHGQEVWKTDGTVNGTVLVKDISPGTSSSFPSSLTAVGRLLLFSASDGDHGLELWRSDGTELGTFMIQDIAVGATSSSPQAFFQAAGTVYFTADDGVHGRELWAIPESALSFPRRVVPVPPPTPSPITAAARP